MASRNPNAQERELLWSKAIGNADLARRLAAEHRHTAGRIAVISSKAKEGLGERPLSELTCADVLGAARRGEACGWRLAELETSEVTDDALVTTPQLREELEALVVRCRLRDQFSGSLGPSFRVRYRPRCAPLRRPFRHWKDSCRWVARQPARNAALPCGSLGDHFKIHW